VRALLATSRAALAEVTANRRSLAAQMAIMIANDAVWIIFWVLFFRSVGEVGGWDTEKILLLQAVLTASGGIALGLLSNARRIGQLAVEGGFDAVLTLPVSPLGHVLLRRVEPTNLGDLAFGVTVFLVAGHPTPARAGIFVVVVLASAALLTGFLVLAGSLAFFAGRSESGELGFHAMLLLGAYPVDVFAGAAKLVLYTVVPAAFVASVPARLVDSFDAGQLAALVVVATATVGIAITTFRAGLRRYTSGAVWTRA
jgi:ABC-2 type transport system permease protein